MDPVVTKAVTSLTSSLAKALWRWAGAGNERGGGETRSARAGKAFQAAVEGAVRELATEGMTDAELAHALALVERLVEAQQANGLPIIETNPAEMPVLVGQWRKAAWGAGLNPATFTISFDRVVGEVFAASPGMRPRRRAGWQCPVRPTGNRQS